jgi:MATE family multidrug resistance protein
VSAPNVNLRTLLAIAWPVVLARATQAVVGLGDALMVSPLGEDALTATTTAAVNSFSAIILPMGTVFIVQSFVAQLVGKGRAGEAHRYAWYGLVIAAIAGVVSLAALPLVRPALSLFHHDPAVEPAMGTYMIIRLTAVGPIVAMEALGNWFGGFGNTKMQMRAGVLTMCTDLLGNWLFIEGHWGAPAWGVAGAAATSVFSSWLGFGYLFLAFRRRWGDIPPATTRVRLSRAELFRVLRFGLPNGANWFLEFGAFALFINVVMADLGKSTLGALNVIIQVNSVAFMPAFGLATAGAILAGQTIGAGAHDRVAPIVRLTLIATSSWMVAVGALYAIFPGTVMGLFAHDDPKTGVSAAELVRIGAPMLAMSSAWQLFDAITMTFAETLRSAGDTTWTLWARVVLAWVFFLPGSLLAIFVLGGGSLTAMACIVAYIAVLAGVMVWRFRSGAWRHIDLTGREPELV